MSFILDALKKSESERQQHSATEFAGIPTNPGSRAVPRWLIVVGVLLAVNLVVLVGLLMRTNTAPVSATLPPVPEETAAERQPQPDVAEPSFADRVEIARREAPEDRQAPRSSPDTETVEPPTPAVQPVLISQDPSSVPASELYPTIHEVRASGLADLPDLHLDIHVYSNVPEDRFVFINMTKLREGSRLEQGPVVVAIAADGVVLEHRGRTFLLPRE